MVREARSSEGQGESEAIPSGPRAVKKCRICHRPFEPRNSLQSCCSSSCAITYARLGGEKRQSAAMKRVALAQAREGKQEKRERKLKSMSLSKLKNLAQREFNRWIRERDFDQGCISCDMPANYEGQWHAGHYRTTAAAPHLRYNPKNCHKQCAQCNHYKSGNTVEYRKRLVAKIGLAELELLEDDNRVVKWTREDLTALRKAYLRKWQELKAAREAKA